MKSLFQEMLELPGLPVSSETIFGATRRSRMLSLLDDFSYLKKNGGELKIFPLTAEQKADRRDRSFISKELSESFEIGQFQCKIFDAVVKKLEAEVSRGEDSPWALRFIAEMPRQQEPQQAPVPQAPPEVRVEEQPLTGVFPADAFNTPVAQQATPAVVPVVAPAAYQPTTPRQQVPIAPIIGGIGAEVNWADIAEPTPAPNRGAPQVTDGFVDMDPADFENLPTAAPTTPPPAPTAAEAAEAGEVPRATMANETPAVGEGAITGFGEIRTPEAVDQIVTPPAVGTTVVQVTDGAGAAGLWHTPAVGNQFFGVNQGDDHIVFTPTDHNLFITADNNLAVGDTPAPVADVPDVQQAVRNTVRRRVRAINE